MVLKQLTVIKLSQLGDMDWCSAMVVNNTLYIGVMKKSHHCQRDLNDTTIAQAASPRDLTRNKNVELTSSQRMSPSLQSSIVVVGLSYTLDYMVGNYYYYLKEQESGRERARD